MDTSKEYIEMCKKAVEVQALWGIMNSGDFYVIAGEIFCVTTHNGELLQEGDSESATWLPRQDQLQEMVGVKVAEDLETCGLFCGWDDGSAWAAISGYPFAVLNKFSMEQLWLAFVMKQRYNKIWSKEEQDWI